MRTLFLALALTALAMPARANDSTAELRPGGIVLTFSNGIELKSEDLFISPSLVTVDYVFENKTDKDIETLVAFPMPDLDGGIEANVAVPDGLSDNFLGFTVTMDGQGIEPRLDQRAVVAGIDVTDELAAHGVSPLPTGESTDAALAGLPDDVAAAWITHGMLAEDTYNDGSGWKTVRVPNWTLRSAYWWPATFPAKRVIKVSHRYHPSVGSTAGLVFRTYDGKRSEDFAAYSRKYCMDDAFMKAVDKASKGDGYLFERRISYVLTSGGNWANGTIGRFRLTVDKEKPENFVSFCGEGVKKIGPTSFEMTAQDLYPARDIEILIVGRAEN